MKPLHLNLATRPYRDYRPYIAVMVIGWLLVAVMALNNLDTWYRYPTPEEPEIRPSRHPFHELPNVIMTPHCSAWTDGMARRRGADAARNIDRFIRGEKLLHLVART